MDTKLLRLPEVGTVGTESATAWFLGAVRYSILSTAMLPTRYPIKTPGRSQAPKTVDPGSYNSSQSRRATVHATQ